MNKKPHTKCQIWAKNDGKKWRKRRNETGIYGCTVVCSSSNSSKSTFTRLCWKEHIFIQLAQRASFCFRYIWISVHTLTHTHTHWFPSHSFARFHRVCVYSIHCILNIYICLFAVHLLSCVCCHAKPSRAKKTNRVRSFWMKTKKNRTQITRFAYQSRRARQPIACKCEPRIGSMIIDQDSMAHTHTHSVSSHLLFPLTCRVLLTLGAADSSTQIRTNWHQHVLLAGPHSIPLSEN